MKVSVIIPTYNEELLSRAILSVPKRDDVEVLVIDDCSEKKYVEGLEKNYPHVRVFHNSTNRGVGYTVNVGLNNCIGEYVVLLGSDDYFIDGEFEKIMEYLDGEYDLVYFNLRINDGRVLKLSEATKNQLCGSVKFMKREFIGTLRNREIRCQEDLYFFQELMKKRPKERFTNLTIKHYNYPKVGSLTYERLHNNLDRSEVKKEEYYETIIIRKTIGPIGGIEQFLYYLAKKYSDKDVLILYENADAEQLKRLRKYVKTMRYNHQALSCERAFFTRTDVGIVSQIKGKKCFIAHGNYELILEHSDDKERIMRELKYISEISDEMYAVSDDSSKALSNIVEKEVKTLRNPFIKEETKKIWRIVYCGRWDNNKGIDLIRKFQKETGCELTIYSNDADISGIFYRKDINAAQYLTKENYDFCIIPSKFEGFCYTLVQCLSNGLPVICSDLKVFRDLGINEHNSIIYTGDNIEEVVEKMKGDFDFEYELTDDNWNTVLKAESKYGGVEMKTIKVIKNFYDLQLKKGVCIGEEYVVEDSRAEQLVNAGYVVYVEKKEVNETVNDKNEVATEETKIENVVGDKEIEVQASDTHKSEFEEKRENIIKMFGGKDKIIKKNTGKNRKSANKKR